MFDSIPVTAIPIESMGFTRMNAQDVSRHLFECASDILQKEGEVPPIVFIFTDKMCFTVYANSFMENSNKKDTLSFFLRKIAAEVEIKGIALIMEGWLRNATKEEMYTGIRADTRPISMHPQRKEAIIAQCEWYDGSQYMLTGIFTKKKDKIGIEEICIEKPSSTSMFEGRFANIFSPINSGGYLN